MLRCPWTIFELLGAPVLQCNVQSVRCSGRYETRIGIFSDATAPYRNGERHEEGKEIKESKVKDNLVPQNGLFGINRDAARNFPEDA